MDKNITFPPHATKNSKLFHNHWAYTEKLPSNAHNFSIQKKFLFPCPDILKSGTSDFNNISRNKRTKQSPAQKDELQKSQFLTVIIFNKKLRETKKHIPMYVLFY